MKYLFSLLTLFATVSAQGQCSEFNNLLNKGDNYLKGNKPNYQEAINAYTAAILACSDRAGEAKQRIAKIVIDINKLKENAEAMEKKAIEAEKVASTERYKAENALVNLEKALADIHEKNLTTFERLANSGANLIYTLDYTEALERMKVAILIEVDTGIKRQRLTEPISELIYFFAKSGTRPMLAISAAELLLQLSPAPHLAQKLQECINEKWMKRSQFTPLLNQLASYHKFQTRYFPEMINIPLGVDSIFDMGDKPDPKCECKWNRQLHKVKLSAYKIAATPTTFYQFALYCEAIDKNLTSKTPYWGRFGDHPAVNVSWYEAIEYANWLNRQMDTPPSYKILKDNNSDRYNEIQTDYLRWDVQWDRSAKGYRLPTEAEWELAARAGVGSLRTLFAGSDTLNIVGWSWENSGDKLLFGDWDFSRISDNNGRTHSVKQKKDNGIGIYDMSGNVYEWCWDWYDFSYYDDCKERGLTINPVGPKSSLEGRVCRGGSWYDAVEYSQTTYRYGYVPDVHYFNFGFRLVFIP